MMSEAPHWSTLDAQRALLERHELSAVELTQIHLDRIARHEPQLRAFIAVDADGALRAAAAADERRAAGAARPFDGVPVAVKDVVDAVGLPTTQGARWLSAHAASDDATPVARLKDAGFVVIGKTNTPEFGFGARCANGLQGPTACPHDLARSSGGSSGGSAAAVAAGMVGAAHGADFGGSVRTPAAFCGVVGLRPTPGRIADPRRALAFDTLTSHGALARGAADAWTLTQAMAGPHPGDPTSLIAPPEPPPEDARRLRIGMAETLGEAPVAAAVRAGLHAAAARMAGVLRLDWAAPDCAGGMDAFATLRAATIRHGLRAHVEAGAPLSETALWNARQGESLTADALMAAQARRGAIRRAFAAFFERFDALALPAAAVAPFGHEVDEVREIDGAPLASIIDYLGVTSLISLVGLPALSLPCWTLGGGMPMGLQLVGPPGSERRLVALAMLLETTLEMRWRPPAGLGDGA